MASSGSALVLGFFMSIRDHKSLTTGRRAAGSELSLAPYDRWCSSPGTFLRVYGGLVV